MNNTTEDQTLPRIQVQPDWNEILSEKQVGSKFWVNMLYQNSSENVYGFLKLDSLKKLVKEGLPDSVEIANVLATKSLSLKYKDNTYKYVSAGIVHPTIMNKHAVLSLDISPAGQLGVSGGSDGLLRIWESATGVVRVSIIGINNN